MVVDAAELTQAGVEVLQLVEVGFEGTPLGDCFFDPLPADLEALLYVFLLGALGLVAEPLHHRQELGNETRDPAWELAHILLDYVEFLEFR